MKFYEIGVGSDFTVPNKNTVYTKVKEQRITCCKVKLNAVEKDTQKEIVFKPMQEVEPKNAN